MLTYFYFRNQEPPVPGPFVTFHENLPTVFKSNPNNMYTDSHRQTEEKNISKQKRKT